MPGSVNIQGQLTGLNTSGSVQIGPFVITGNTAGNFISYEADLGTGSLDSFDIPTWATGCLIIPPATNTVALTLKGADGDTGILLSPNLPSLLSFATPPTTAAIYLFGTTSTHNPTTIVFF